MKLMKRLLRDSVPFAALLVLASAAQAGPITSITISDCDDQGCEGTSLFLSVEDNMDGTFTVVQSIDSTGFSEITLGMNQVGFKAIQNWTSADLISAPTTGWLDPAVESVVASNSLCGTGTSSDMVCTHGFVDITSDGVYTWDYLITGGTMLDPIDWHWGGQFADEAGEATGNIISAAIPEPNAALLFGVGALVVSGRVRRR